MRSGKAAVDGTPGGGASESQWSLTFEVRKRYPAGSYFRILEMSQWSLTFEVRKRRVNTHNLFLPVCQSQWSLTFEVRKSDPGSFLSCRVRLVAMEPDL